MGPKVSGRLVLPSIAGIISLLLPQDPSEVNRAPYPAGQISWSGAGVKHPRLRQAPLKFPAWEARAAGAWFPFSGLFIKMRMV
jgi:hypothetical protein